MKKIVLIRHGKSSWKYDVSDRDRPLKSRGKTDAIKVVNQFVKKSKVPKMVFSSPAKRALSTCKIFTKELNLLDENTIISEDLYDFDGKNVINFINKLPNDYDDIMIFGHNHAFTSIANVFGSIFIDNLPTCGLVKISFETNDWNAIKNGKTEFIIIPKELK